MTIPDEGPAVEEADLLQREPVLRILLQAYRDQHRRRPDDDWHDRVMQVQDVAPQRLCELHGLALAVGWIDTRVKAAAFEQPGRIRDCYRISPAGRRALDATADQVATEVVEEGEPVGVGW